MSARAGEIESESTILNAEQEASMARIGRPSLTGRDEESPVVTTRVPSELREALEARAADEDKSVSELARDAIDAYLR